MTEANWLAGEVTELASINENLTRAAQDESRDLTGTELEMIERNSARLGELQTQLDAVQKSQSARAQSLESLARLGPAVESRGAEHEYKSAGEYICDVWGASIGRADADQRMRRYHSRVAAHDTTADGVGVLPQPIVGEVVSFIDMARPVLSFLGVGSLPSGPTFYRPKVTQHTAVAVQASEKGELTSQKMIIGRLTVNVATYGGYVNVSRQLADWSQPDAMQLIVNDLASNYALATENAAVDAFVAGGTAGGGSIPADGNATGTAAAIWGAAAKVYAATKGQGRIFLGCGPDMLGKIAPAFAPYNPTNAQGVGFTAAGFGQGVVGTISGVPVVMSAAFDAGKAFVASTAAIEAYEQRVGALQVTEPSVLGTQVAYAGYFAQLLVEAAGVQLIIQGV
jgi:HK97 family phage major capsid protein